MLQLFKRSKKKREMENQLMETSDLFNPPPYFTIFEEEHPIDYIGNDGVIRETLRVQAKLEIRAKKEIMNMGECLKILEVWIDEQNCPHWQIGLDTWIFICLGLHAKKDPNCKYTNLYVAQIDQVIEFLIKRPKVDCFQYKKHTQIYETTHRGGPCYICYESNIGKSKRTGVSAKILYDYPLRDGSKPPDIEFLPIRLPVEFKTDNNGDHIIP
ncbi:matrix [Mount Elgon bat virus]|uniref:Matrix protein n=1 Tax=Mount Elgon bat virus TaxID=380434 RepID=A0A0D3R1N9_9RHAB|nr:matrix [Mount Elgon bat virus]AJR28609.1 matrix [Mount Elgon bat virus]